MSTESLTTTAAAAETATPATTTTESSQTSATASETSTNEGGETSLLNQEDPPPAETKTEGAPETYTDYKLPEGYTVDPAIITDANAVFKELNLNQEQAQKLVDLFSKHNQDIMSKTAEAFTNLRKEWQGQAQTYLGNNAKQAKADIGAALNNVFAKEDGTPDAAKINGFRMVMDMTGAGDNPFFVEAFHKLAKAAIEGKAVQGGGPSAFGQKKPGSGPASLASAIYPNLAGQS